MFTALENSDLHLVTDWGFVFFGYKELDFAVLVANFVGCDDKE